MTNATKRAQRLTKDALENAAQNGVERALAARQLAGVELSANDIDNVSGGLLAGPIINGGRPFDISLITAQPETQVITPVVQELGGVAGGGLAGGGIAGIAGAQGMVA
jgi:hypothetical protein